MVLAGMIQKDEAALMCDLAETYQIYDYRQLPATQVAVFACGLRENSRIQLVLNEQVVPLDTLLLASISDKLSLLLWVQTKDGQKGKNQPNALAQRLSKPIKEESKELVFHSSEGFETKRKQLLASVQESGEDKWQQN